MTLKIAKISKDGTISAMHKYDGTNYETDWIDSVTIKEVESVDIHTWLTYFITLKDGAPATSECFALTNTFVDTNMTPLLVYI